MEPERKQAIQEKATTPLCRHNGDTEACSSHVDAVMAVGISVQYKVPRALCLCACKLYALPMLGKVLW